MALAERRVKNPTTLTANVPTGDIYLGRAEANTSRPFPAFPKRGDKNLSAIDAAMIAAGFKPVASDKGHYQFPIGVLTQARVEACTKEHPNGN